MYNERILISLLAVRQEEMIRMGIFASLAKNPNAQLPAEKKDEFKERMIELLDRGGMMKVEPYTLYGQRYAVLRRLRGNEPINFYYNYFDDDTSEDASFNTKELYAWSNKLVGANFYKVMLAAYALEGLYYSGINVVDDNADFISGDYYIGWINSIFNESFVSRSIDPWDVYLALKGTEYEEYMTPNKFRYYKRTYVGYLGYLDVMAVTEGLTELKEFFDGERSWRESDDSFEFRKRRGRRYKLFIESLKKFSGSSLRSKDEQLELLFELLRDIYGAEDTLDALKKYEPMGYKDIYLRIWVFESPAIVVKAIAELYEKDFWTLWSKISDVAKREQFPDDDDEKEILTISTEDFVDLSTDDLVLYWTEDKPLNFSAEMEAWLAELKGSYDAILKEGVKLDKPFRYIQEVLDYAEEYYSHIYLFNDFVDETMDKINKAEFMALWILFERVLQDEKNLAASKDLIEAAEGYEDDENYAANRNRVCDVSWRFVRREYKFNSGRRNIRRFVALVANKELRHKVFGI